MTTLNQILNLLCKDEQIEVFDRIDCDFNNPTFTGCVSQLLISKKQYLLNPKKYVVFQLIPDDSTLSIILREVNE